MGRGRRGSRAREEGRGERGLQSPSPGGPGRSCPLSPGPPTEPGSPWPPGWAAAPASWLSSPAARVGAHFLAGTSDSGSVTWQRSHVTGARRSPNWRKGKRQRRGGGRGAVGKGRRAAPGRLPPSATADPLTPHSPRPSPPQSAESLGDQTPARDKLVERRAAGERHLTALELCLAVPEEPGSHSTAVRAPRPPPGAPRAALSPPGGAAGRRAPASPQ